MNKYRIFKDQTQIIIIIIFFFFLGGGGNQEPIISFINTNKNPKYKNAFCQTGVGGCLLLFLLSLFHTDYYALFSIVFFLQIFSHSSCC